MRTIQFLTLATFAVTSALAQPSEDLNKELSLSGAYQSFSSGSGSGSSSAFLLSPRLGFFVAGGLEIEPEFLVMFGSGSEAIYMLNGNLSYNFISAGKGVPFVLLGYGTANTIPVFNVPTARTGFGVGVLNMGAGVKAFLKEDIAIRFEYRYQQFSGEGEFDYGYFSYRQKVDMNIHTVQFGLSVLL